MLFCTSAFRSRIVAISLAIAVTGCSSGSESPAGSGAAVPLSTSTSATAGPTTEAISVDSEDSDDSDSTEAVDEETLLPGQTLGQDDYNDDGDPDPTCGEQDFGAGLVLRILCEIEGRNSDPPDGVTLVQDSLFRLPTDSDVDLTGISGSAVYARDAAGDRVFIIVFNSDGLFSPGSAEVEGTDTFDNLVQLIDTSFPGSELQVRGHTDSTGSEEANQALSEQRAANVVSYMEAKGVDASSVSSVGFGEAQPLAIEDNDAALKFNRRVELVIRPPA